MGALPTKQPSIIDQQVNGHCVFIYSTTVCPYCDKAKQLLDDLNAEYGSVELNALPPGVGGQMVEQLREKTNCATVPQIFINGKFIGGYSEVLMLKNAGLLFNKLSECPKPCVK